MRILDDGVAIRTKHVDESCATILLGEYASGVPLIMIESVDGERLCVATTNLEGYGKYPEEGNVFIKDWSENEGVLDALVKAEIISKPVREVPAGFATAYECTLLP